MCDIYHRKVIRLLFETYGTCFCIHWKQKHAPYMVHYKQVLCVA